MLEEWIEVMMAIVAVALIITFIMVAISKTNTYKEEAIKHECAQYNPQTGVFEWIKK